MLSFQENYEILQIVGWFGRPFFRLFITVGHCMELTARTISSYQTPKKCSNKTATKL